MLWKLRRRGVVASASSQTRTPQPPTPAGKYKGSLLRAVAMDDRNYLQWMAGASTSFPDELKDIVRGALAGNFPVRQQQQEQVAAAAADGAAA